jgi:Zn-dependent protease with chaperone function
VRVVVVLASLILFLVVYGGLVVGSAYLSYYSFVQLNVEGQVTVSPRNHRYHSSKEESDSLFPWLILGICSGALCLFLAKGLFRWQKSDRSLWQEITEKEHAALFTFIRRLCRDTGAPLPRRIFLTPEVNAAVSYNSNSFLSLILPAHKNLVIGLGLVNRLNLSEFKAVLAHEFGHFSQNSMKLGTYVDRCNRIIVAVVFGRDWLDEVVTLLGRIDFRLAVLGWAFAGLLWGLRKLLQGLFRVINFANSALCRQMEFNADLVAVKVTGSDALIHALARLEFAHEALMQACQDVTVAAEHRLYTRDLFYHQTRAAEFLRGVRKNPRLGEPPPLPDDLQQSVRAFEPGNSSVPLMWATHPPNYDREQNAKRLYLRGTVDKRSPWILFQDPAAVREHVTRRFYQVNWKSSELSLANPELVQAFIDEEHAETTYDPRYHGLYHDRFIQPGKLNVLVHEPREKPNESARLREAHAELYGDELRVRMEQYSCHRSEYYVLQGLAAGTLRLKGKDFPFRERCYRLRDVKQLLGMVETELQADNDWLATLDRKVFLVHQAMAQQISPKMSSELTDRYRFHLALQQLLGTLNVHQGKAQMILNAIAGRRRISRSDFCATVEVLRQAHRYLLEVLALGQRHLRLPALKHVKAGEPLSNFLGDPPDIRELSGTERSLDSAWINGFLQKLAEVVGKARRIHFKSLGGILAYQEKIAELWAARTTAPEAIQMAFRPET